MNAPTPESTSAPERRGGGGKIALIVVGVVLIVVGVVVALAVPIGSQASSCSSLVGAFGGSSFGSCAQYLWPSWAIGGGAAILGIILASVGLARRRR